MSSKWARTRCASPSRWPVSLAAELSVQIEDNQLVIRGRQAEDEGRVYLHRGIAARHFQRSFVLADGIEVTSAALDNGLLNIDLRRRAAETLVRSIEIETGSNKTGKPANGERNGS